jgi:hypothetical protein
MALKQRSTIVALLRAQAPVDVATLLAVLRMRAPSLVAAVTDLSNSVEALQHFIQGPHHTHVPGSLYTYNPCKRVPPYSFALAAEISAALLLAVAGLHPAVELVPSVSDGGSRAILFEATGFYSPP